MDQGVKNRNPSPIFQSRNLQLLDRQEICKYIDLDF